MRAHKLRLKAGLYLALALSPLVLLLPLAIVRHQAEHLQEAMALHATQVAEVLVRSTRHAMLVDQREIVEKIIEDVGRQHAVERVRVLAKDGTIVYSKRPSETGSSVEQNEEPCVRCHKGRRPPAQLPDAQRWRIDTGADGTRLLSTMAPIRNERSCSEAECHEHSPGQQVLGVVDVAFSLDDMDHKLKRHFWWVVGIAGATVVGVATGVALLWQRMIYRPLLDLDRGAQRISTGALEHRIPVRSDDEFGRVATSFNQMSAQLQGLVRTLEQQVEERTRALQAAQAEVAQSEKLASIGLLASGIAHELNSPLTGVLTFTSLLRRKMPEGSLDAEDLDLVIHETKRCASIIRRLLDFSREKVPTKGWVDLPALIDNVVRIVDRPVALQDIHIRTAIDPALPRLWADADLLEQVLMNLLVNAAHAIEGRQGGRIEVAASALPVPEGASPMIEIEVRDNGCGITEENLQRIFDPFFTTKDVGKGTGLGLSVSYGIVKAHGGSIKVQSIVGQGSTFRLRLPTRRPDADPATTAPQSGPAP